MPRIRIVFEKKGWITFLNHLDLPVLFSRAARRAGLLQEFTKGYSPHPHISLSQPLAIGVEGWAEPADFWFVEWNGGSCEKWNENLPEGLKILKWAEVDGAALAKLTTGAQYRIKGVGATLGEDAKTALEEAVRGVGELYGSELQDDGVVLRVGSLERCGASLLVRALSESGVCAGWTELCIVRESVGTWDSETGEIVPLI